MILVALVLIAGGLIIKQARFDEKFFTVAQPNLAPSDTAPVKNVHAMDLASYLPTGMVPMSPPEFFGPENLSEKINGKAELYLSSGFLGLTCQRFMAAGIPAMWFEVFSYDMGSPRNAFSVFSTQRRPDAMKLDLTASAYKTENALFFAHGPYYLEIIAAAKDMENLMQAFAQSFVTGNRVGSADLDEADLFPKESLIDGSIVLLAENVFGYGELNHVFIARYSLNGAQLTAFLSRRGSPEEAENLASGFRDMLLENGGLSEKLSVEIPHAWMVRIFDTLELVFVHENLLAGVHEAEDKDLAESLALMMHKAFSDLRPK